MSGNHTTIRCTNLSVGIVIIDVKNIAIQNMKITDCGKSYSYYLAFPLYLYPTQTLHMNNVALQLHYCESAVVKNISITVNMGIDGLAAVNVIGSELSDVHVNVVSSQISDPTTNGMLLHYYNYTKQGSYKLIIKNFIFTQTFCFHKTQNVFLMLLNHIEKRFLIVITIMNTKLKGLCNARILCYHSVLNSEPIEINFKNCYIYNNTANISPDLSVLFLLTLTRSNSDFVNISNTKFYKNVNLSSIIAVTNDHTTSHTFSVEINNCSFNHNQVMNIIKIIYKVIEERGKLVNMEIYNTNITNNKHGNGNSLILTNNGDLFFSNTKITNNNYYENIVRLNKSSMIIENYVVISNNFARHVLNIKETSYILMDPKSTLKVTNNVVYLVLTKMITITKQVKPLCYFQFASMKTKNINSTIIDIVGNMYTAPNILSRHENYFRNCEWITFGRSSLIESSPDDVFATVLNMTNEKIDKKGIGLIPSSICRCETLSKYDCTSHELGQVFPGQILVINLIVPRLLSSRNSVILLYDTTHSPSNGCRIGKATEMLQMHANTGCNQYNYTVWSDKTECELHLSAEGIPEIFYVKLLPCPVGFHYKFKDVTVIRCWIVTLFLSPHVT